MSETAHLVAMFDSTVVRAHVSAAGAKGGQDDQALGRLCGGFSTKIHLKVDLGGLPLAFHLTGGEAMTAATSKSCLISDPTSRPAPPSLTRVTTPKPTAKPPVAVASARSSRTNQ